MKVGEDSMHEVHQTGTTTSIESQRALAWIVRQLSWERTLEQLRTKAAGSATEEAAEERVAA